MKNEKRLFVLLPKPMHDQIWRTSGKLKVNLVAHCLMIEYLLDPDLQKRVKKRIIDGFNRKNEPSHILNLKLCTHFVYRTQFLFLIKIIQKISSDSIFYNNMFL